MHIVSAKIASRPSCIAKEPLAMTKPGIEGGGSPWLYTEGIGSAFVDTPRPALKSGAALGPESSRADA